MGIWKKLQGTLDILNFGEHFPGYVGSVSSPVFVLNTLQAYSNGEYYEALICAMGAICSIYMMYADLEPYFERRKRYRELKAAEEESM